MGEYSFVEAFMSFCMGEYSFVEAFMSFCVGEYSFVEAFMSFCMGGYSFVEAFMSFSMGEYSFVEAFMSFCMGESTALLRRSCLSVWVNKAVQLSTRRSCLSQKVSTAFNRRMSSPTEKDSFEGVHVFLYTEKDMNASTAVLTHRGHEQLCRRSCLSL